MRYIKSDFIVDMIHENDTGLEYDDIYVYLTDAKPNTFGAINYTCALICLVRDKKIISKILLDEELIIAVKKVDDLAQDNIIKIKINSKSEEFNGNKFYRIKPFKVSAKESTALKL